MPNDLPQLLFLQVVYILIMALIIRYKLKKGQSAIFYWLIAALYLFVAICLLHEYITMPTIGEGGTWFAIEMYGMFVPGLLVGAALIALFVDYVRRDFKTKR
ncbi:hypothetical protein [Mucilaginibacter sp. CSA2-8R]|uniref:hypothetical protein n=1 Tax=Mucilaginibacter sp. CSA2-8R TaxID=3141542 RepID=UPI00315CAA11